MSGEEDIAGCCVVSHRIEIRFQIPVSSAVQLVDAEVQICIPVLSARAPRPLHGDHVVRLRTADPLVDGGPETGLQIVAAEVDYPVRDTHVIERRGHRSDQGHISTIQVLIQVSAARYPGLIGLIAGNEAFSRQLVDRVHSLFLAEVDEFEPGNRVCFPWQSGFVVVVVDRVYKPAAVGRNR